MKTLSLEVQEGVAWIRLTRPEKRNPMDSELREDLMAVLAQVRADSVVRVVVLAGSAGAFCAGGNLQLIRDNLDSGPAYWKQRMQESQQLVDSLLRLARPVIAVVDGPAIGAGFSLALAADLVLASPQARFAMSHLKLGLVPDLGPLYTLPRVVGLQRAKELMLSAREIDAEEARSLGIVLEVQPSDSIEARAREIANSLVQASPAAVALIKAALNVSLDSDQATMFALEASAQAEAFSAKEPRQAVEAMFARQAPAYRGFTRRAG
ncbi:MAG: enoyl-CoA hydratase/isomerase family protein [Ramlibacter sp.]